MHIPPSIVAYDNGIRNFLEDRFSFSDQFLIMGAKIITTGVLFKNADNTETGNIILGMISTLKDVTIKGEEDVSIIVKIFYRRE